MSDYLHITHSDPIPPIFQSEKLQQPFSNCTMCNKQLGNNDELYLIEKAFASDIRTGEPKLVFELACCMDCRSKMHNELSEESRAKIEAYFSETTVALEKRDEKLKELNLMEPEIWLSNCMVKNTPIDELKEYQIYALCWKNQLIYHQFPYLISGEAIDEIMELLSEKSRGYLDDLLTDLIDFPPDFEEIFNIKTRIII